MYLVECNRRQSTQWWVAPIGGQCLPWCTKPRPTLFIPPSSLLLISSDFSSFFLNSQGFFNFVCPYCSPLLFYHSSQKTGRRFLLTCSVIEWLGSARAKMACTAPLCTILLCTALQVTALNSTAHHCTSLHYTVLHITALQSTARHYPLFCTGQSR